MLKKVPIKSLKPNPVIHRDRKSPALSADAIKDFAAMVKETGDLHAPPTVRERNGHYEIACGERRWNMLRARGDKEIEVDVQNLTDDQMAVFSVKENMHRWPPTEEEKVNAWTELVQRVGREKAKKYMAIGEQTASSYDTASRNDYRKYVGPLSTRTIFEADRLGGPEMVEAIVKHPIGSETLKEIGTTIRKEAGGDEQLKKELIEEVKKGRVVHQKDVKEAARKVYIRKIEGVMKKARTVKKPTDLIDLAREWIKNMPSSIAVLRDACTAEAAVYLMKEEPALTRDLSKLLAALSEVSGRLAKLLTTRIGRK